jgi:hypothetical protein
MAPDKRRPKRVRRQAPALDGGSPHHPPDMPFHYAAGLTSADVPLPEVPLPGVPLPDAS